MRKLFNNILVGCITVLLLSCNNEPTKNAGLPSEEVSEALPEQQSPVYHLDLPYAVSLGDLNNDGINDTIFVSEPKLKLEDEMSCIDSSCTTFFHFNHYFTGFSHEQALGGAIGSAGDLDNDGIHEIYFVPDWFTSNWTGLNIYSFKYSKWKKIANVSIRRTESGEEADSLYLPYDQRIIRHKNYFELLENVMDEDGNEKLVPKRFNL